MSRSSLTSRVVGFCLTALALGACQAVAGIEDRTFDPDALAPPASPQCQEYCSVVMSACKGTNAVYTTEAICLGVCAQLDPGDDEDTSGNSVACRLYQANIAKDEPGDYCKGAGPGGNGVCGSDCEAYCQIFPKVCPKDDAYKSTDDCVKLCEALPSQPDYDVMRDHGGDTIECRLVHTSSATVDPSDHCPHAPIRPTEPWCIGADDDAPNCDDYCSIELAACQGDLAQYQSLEQCKAVCGALDLGTNADEAGNTVACRRYHSFNSTALPDTHCSHSGPAGDGHCGDHGTVAEGHTGNCESYCQLLAAACPDDFPGEQKCVDECVGLPEAAPDSKYSLVNAEASNGLSCRILYTARALTDPTACASAIGNDQCK